ncbi:transposase [Mycobacterium sp. Soil538]|nr:transposase [Mycobacterium sp. Soil538]
MIVIGIDAHKRTHTLVAADATGRKVRELTVEATDRGHAKALRWALLHFADQEVKWAVEDVRHVSGRVERHLMDAGQQVVRVGTSLMSRTRASALTPGKSDPIDALAIARAALREPDLPVATHDSVSRELQLLVNRREDLVLQRTATVNRLLWRIHELDPSRSPGVLNYPKHRAALRVWLGGLSGIVAELALDELADIARLTEAINGLEKRIRARVRVVAPRLLALPGCGALTAAKIMGETALITRFRNEAAFSRYAGLAPQPDWSGSTAGRMRASRGGNRQLNSAVHRVAVVQKRLDGPGQAYLQKRTASGDTNAAAVRALKRRLGRVVYRCLCEDYRMRST